MDKRPAACRYVIDMPMLYCSRFYCSLGNSLNVFVCTHDGEQSRHQNEFSPGLALHELVWPNPTNGLRNTSGRWCIGSKLQERLEHVPFFSGAKTC